MAFLEPHEKIWREESGQYFKLSEVRSKPDTVAPFDGVCDFSPSIAEYSGTIFRFPLRNAASDLSEQLYDLDKLKALFSALKCEGKHLLLFLRSVDTVEVYEINPNGQQSLKFKTSIASEVRDVVYEKRKIFLQTVQREHEVNKYGIRKCIPLTLDFNVTVVDDVITMHHWTVVSQVGSSNERVLQCASCYQLMPWVGVAMETGESQRQAKEGRVFCFLPMPIEASSPLPIYVNGTFGLSDDRRTLKWQSSERQNDKAAEWNKVLVSDVVPPCYALLIRYAIDSLQMPYTDVYNIWPDVAVVRGTKWEPLLSSLFKTLILYDRIMWTHNPKDIPSPTLTQGEWISISKATFIPNRETQNLAQLAQVHRSLYNCGVKLVEAPASVHNALSYVGTSTISLTPALAKEKLKANYTCYQNVDIVNKFELLMYCTSDNQYNTLIGLELLPLDNNTFTAFQQKTYYGQPIYICNSYYPRELFPNKGHVIVSCQRAEVLQELTKVASSGQTQVQVMELTSAIQSIKQCFPYQWQQQQEVTVSITDPSFPATWFTTFWKWVQPHDLNLFVNEIVIPLGREPSSCVHNFRVTRLSSKSPILYMTNNDNLNEHLLSGLPKLPFKITSTQAHPHLAHRQLDTYVNRPTPAGILDALSNSCNEQLSKLHGSNLTNNEAYQLCVLLSQQTQLSSHRYKVLLNLPIFSSLNQTSSLCNVSTSAQASWGKKALVQPQELPLSAKHLPDSLVIFLPSSHQLPLLKLLSDHVQVPTVIQFILNTVFPMISQGAYKPLSSVDAIMSDIIVQLSTWKWNYPNDIPILLKSVSELPFLPVDGNVSSQRRRPKDLYDPSNSELQALFQGEQVFPCAPFNGQNHLLPLRECGLMSEVSPQAIVNIITSIGLPSSARPHQVDPVRYSRAKAVLIYLSNHPIPNEEQLAKMTTSLSWLPINSTPPNCYPPCLQWKGAEYKSHFSSLDSSFAPSSETRDLPLILGSQMFITDGLVPANLLGNVNVESLAPLVVAHFQEVIVHHADIAPPCLEKMVHLIYQYLSKQTAVSTLLQTLPPWVYIKGKFVSPKVVAIEGNSSFLQDLTPYVYTLPENLASKYQSLFTHCGVEKSLTRRQICSVLEMMQSSGGSEVSPERAWHIVVSILNWLTSNGEEMAQLDEGEALYVPIECDSKGPRLEDFTKVTYSDNEFLRNILSASGQEMPHVFLDHRVTSLAHCLHLSPLSDRMSITEDAFEDAGQHEPLTVRLKNILKEYKDGLTIIKEMLQNADDAGATELNICYDGRTHTTERKSLFFPDMVDSHGPALVIHNNSTFTDDDFRNITKLAGATKEGTPLKIGKFGVGFCSVYHITDVPSFISRDYLHIFDPTLKYLKGAVNDFTKPGKKLNLSHPILRASKQLQPYQGLFGFNSQQSFNGTVFRLPFRTSPSEISSTMYSKHTIDEMVSDLKRCSSELILFLRHVTKITFCSIEANSSTPCILVEIQKTSQQYGGNRLLTITTKYDGGSSSSKIWLVCSSEENISGKQGTGSVACLLEMHDGGYKVQRCIGETFCFLPLSKSTGLPVHVSANFAVMTNRTGIWAEDNHTPHSTKESQWNVSLMETVIPQAYHSLLEALKGLEQEGKLAGYVFHSLWPLDKELEQHHPWTACIAALYKMISAGQLMHSYNISQWLTVKDSRFIAPAIFAVSSAHADTPPCIVEAIEKLCLPVVDLPLDHRECIVQLEQSIITEQMFAEIFFQNIGLLQDMQECRNAVLVTLLEVFAVEIGKGTERERTLKCALEGHNCVPCTPNGATLKKCCELVHPQSEFAAMFDNTDSMFPSIAAFESSLAKQAMQKLGLHYDSVPWKFVIERAQTIGSLYKIDRDKALKRVEYILQSIHKNMAIYPKGTVPVEAKGLAAIQFLPVKQKPDVSGYPLPWFGESCPPLRLGKDLVTFGPDTSASYNIELIAGSSIAIFQWSFPDGCVIQLPADVCTLLQIRSTPSCAEVMAHLKQLIATVSQLDSDATIISSVHSICDAVYSFFDHFLGSKIQLTGSEIDEMRTLHCIWTGKEFICPNMVAKNWALDGPYLFKVPTILLYRQRLVGFLHIQSLFTINDALGALKQMADDFGNEPVSEVCQQVISNIIPLLLEGKTEGLNQTVMLPDQTYVLHDANQLAFNDTPWCEAGEGTILLHDNIPRPLALKLGIKTVRSLIVEKYASLFEYTEDAEAFGQDEPLTRRIQNILQDYPNDETVLKELLQNADDAKANKMYVILDKRKHGEKVFNEKWKDLQGPALLVWNSSVFKPSDIEGIQKLGFGGKRSDAETIGQYGIGFNAVYHLTDCPSFVSNGETMCIFDPHCKYAPGANVIKPGRRFDRLNDGFWQKFPDLASSYLQEGLQNCSQDLKDELKGGSLFRFPLRRTHEMVTTSLIVPLQPNGSKPPPLDAEKMQKVLEKWAPCMKQSMFFLNNVTEIKFFVIEADSHHLDVTHHFSTRVDQASMRQLDEFKGAVHDFTSVSGSEPKTVMYTLHLCETKVQGESTNKQRKEKKIEERWLIQQGIGDIDQEMQKWTYIKQMKPRHGIAAPLDAVETLQGQVYCFLPLPIMSHLPVHINGHFALNTARRDLWKHTDPTRANSDDPRLIWNRNLMSAISSSYCNFLVEGRRHVMKHKEYSTYDQMREDLAHYYSLFPHLHPLKEVWEELAKDVYKKLIYHNSRILAVPDHERACLLLSADDDNMVEEPTPMLSVKWHALHSATSREQAHFFQVDTNTLYHHSKHDRSSRSVASTAIVPSNGHPNTQLSGQPQRTGYLCLEGRSTVSPNAQSVTTAGGDNGDDIRCILEMTGMVITLAPHSIRADLSACGLTSLPTTIAQTVYSYYSNYHDQVLPDGGKFPCDVEDTKFKTVANFKRFLEYILNKRNNFSIFVGDTSAFPEGLPLLTTADQQIRRFDKKTLVLMSNFSGLFPRSHHKFLHSDLLCLNMELNYFLTPADGLNCNDDYYNLNLDTMLCEILPDELLDEQAESEMLHEEKLKSLWKCFNEDPIFKSCLDVIVKKWALLPSSCKHLFSTRSPVLPIVEPSREGPGYNSIGGVVTLLHSLGMFFVEQWLPHVAHRFCGQIYQYSKVLLYLVSLHRRSPINATINGVKMLMGYFRHINFQQDRESTDLIRQLPFFQDIFGNWTDLNGKTVYVLPKSIELCLEGVEECLKKIGAVLLDHNGAWNVVTPADINATEMQDVELYTKCIFSNFSSLKEDQRYKHLKHIRDNLYDRCCAVLKIKYHPRDDLYHRFCACCNFVDSLKTLRCLGPENSILKPVSDFCDHKQTIFSVSKKKYNFLPEYFTYTEIEVAKWLVFFRELGLKVHIPEEDFMQLIQMAINGQCDIPINEASSILLHFLFECYKHYSSGFLYKVSGMPFVPVRELKHLTWIAPACAAPHRLQKGEETTDMAPLRGAYCGKDENLVWTIMPVITSLSYNSVHVLKDLGVMLEPQFEDALNNIVQITKGVFSNRALFEQPSHEVVIPEDGNDLVTVMSSIFAFLQSGMDKASPKLLDSLSTLACVPVHAQIQLGPTIPVLVKPSEVVATDEARQYYPFLHCLPYSLYAFMDKILQRIGVKRTIDPVHMRTVLEMAYKQSDQLHLDVNTKRTVHTSLNTLYSLLKKMKGTDIPDMSPLYLPDQSGKLCVSTSLVYCDNVQYSHKVLEFSRAGLSIFLLPPQLGIQEEEFCSLLPEVVRPKCISKCITKVRHGDCLQVATPLVVQLHQTLKMPELIKAIVKVIEHLAGGTDLTLGIHDDLTRILSHIQVSTVQDLSHSIATAQSACDIGTIKLKYELIEESGHCRLYIDSARQSQTSMITCKLVCDAMSDFIIKHLESFSKQQTYNVLLQLKEYISTLLMVQRLEDIQDVLQTLNLRLDTRELSYHELEPRLGDPIPLTWHHRLDQAPGNIFRPQEWVGYETEDESIVFAQVVHPVESSDTAAGELKTKYRVYITEDDVTGIIVSSLSLYKFLRGASRPNVSFNGIEQRLELSTQSNIPKVDVTAYEAMLQLSKELKDVWQLSESERKRAIKRFYLEWHPDKNPGKVVLAEEVYKYLRQQISRLEKGLPLEDPPMQPAESPAPKVNGSETPPPKWQPYFTEWDKTAHSHQQSERSEQQGKSTKTGPTPKWQPNADPSQGRLWINQAEADWKVVCVLLDQVSVDSSISCHVCFHAYEVVSKVVRGGLMAVCGLRERGATQENLVHQAMALEAEVPKLKGCVVHNVEVLVKYEMSTRFPQPGQPTPVNLFNLDHAKKAARYAWAVLKTVKDAVLK